MDDLNLNVDLMGADGGTGEVASHIAGSGKLNVGAMRPFVYMGKDPKYHGKSFCTVYTGGDPKKKESYRTIQVNAGTLRRDEWKALDEAVLRIAEHRLQGTQDLIGRGLVYNLGNAMGTTVLEYHDVSDALEAGLSMDGVTRQQGDRPEFKSVYLPIPIIHADFEINERVLQVSRNMGNGLDTIMAERAARKVAVKLEKMLFTDETYGFGGGKIYSLVNFPHRKEYSLGTAWTSLSDNDSEGTVGEQIVTQVLDMKQTMINDSQFGPYVLYVPTNYETLIDSDYNSYKTNTIRERILKISNIQDIVVVDTLTSDNIVMLQLSTDTIRIVRGLGLQSVQWATEGNFVNKYKVLTIQVPQIRADQNNNTGLLHASV